MTVITDKIKHWPRTRGGELIFESSEDAVSYGSLVSNYRNKINNLKYLRSETYKQIALEKQRKAPDIQRIFDLAVKAQFFREAYDEAERHYIYQITLK